MFPLLLVFVTVLGIVLQDDDELREDLVDGALGQIPVIGSQLAGTDSLPGDGLRARRSASLTALWAGLGAVAALQHGLDTIADVPVHDRGNFVVTKRSRRSPSWSLLRRSACRCRRSLGNLATRRSTSASSPARSGCSRRSSSTPRCC